ncbi:YggN family protein [Thalassotalea sp. LPB0316]|uniref:DUF2884 family protein n=1 Tax=Thalassotalea sp. LPB0316 TaxID=2769490 RepID=UPI0018662129|nr:DUF2884 family protein [Thalassotalea sp. LPB0316]QOL25309.1 YggN family protein [Thalassotalea sp. LPB0316]
MKTLPTILVLAATTSSTFALAGNNCDVNLDANFSLKDNQIIFSDDHQHELYRITAKNELVIDNHNVRLSAAGQSSLNAYASGIRDVVPQVRDVAIEGVNIAIEGVNLAFDGLLGEGNDVSEDLTFELSQIRDQLAHKFDSGSGIYIGNGHDMAEDVFGEDFEQRFEDVLESAIERSMGSLLMAVGREMIFSGGDMEAFEARMEDFGHNIESQMEARAENIEKSAYALCEQIVHIDKLEDELKANVPELSKIDVLHVHGHSHKDI